MTTEEEMRALAYREQVARRREVTLARARSLHGDESAAAAVRSGWRAILDNLHDRSTRDARDEEARDSD